MRCIGLMVCGAAEERTAATLRTLVGIVSDIAGRLLGVIVFAAN
jgi:hypothetical protein